MAKHPCQKIGGVSSFRSTGVQQRDICQRSAAHAHSGCRVVSRGRSTGCCPPPRPPAPRRNINLPLILLHHRRTKFVLVTCMNPRLNSGPSGGSPLPCPALPCPALPCPSPPRPSPPRPGPTTPCVGKQRAMCAPAVGQTPERRTSPCGYRRPRPLSHTHLQLSRGQHLQRLNNTSLSPSPSAPQFCCRDPAIHTPRHGSDVRITNKSACR